MLKISGYLHQVRSYGRSLSVSTLWTPTREFNDTGCAAENETEHFSMRDVNFVWKLYEVRNHSDCVRHRAMQERHGQGVH